VWTRHPKTITEPTHTTDQVNVIQATAERIAELTHGPLVVAGGVRLRR
jgi:hypothetical protein